MSPMAIGNVPPIDRISAPSGEDSIEEVCFIAALICLDGHFDSLPSIPGPQTQQKVAGMVARTLEKTHSRKDVRESLARNVEIWVYLTRIFNNAIDNLTARSVASMSDSAYDDKNGGGNNGHTNGHNNGNGNGNGHSHGHSHLHGHGGHDNSELMIKNHASLKEDLQILNKLMHIARNLLVCTNPEVPQDICAAVSFDAVVFQIIVLCVNLAGKGYHGEVADEPSRAKLNEIYDLFKKLLVTSLQQVHNWTAKNDRNKTAFWYYVFFEDETMPDDMDAISHDGTDYRPDIAKVEMKQWLARNATICDEAKSRLIDYANTHQSKAPGIPSLNTPLARLWIPKHLLEPDDDMPNLPNLGHDGALRRMSNEAEVWWELVRDPNLFEWRQPMPDREYGKRRQKFFSEILESRFSSGWRLRDENRVQGYGANMPDSFFGLLSPAQEAELSAEYGGHYGTPLPHDEHQEERVVENVDEDYEEEDDDDDDDDDEDDEDDEDLEDEEEEVEVEEADEEYDVHSHLDQRHDRNDGHPYADMHGDDFNEEEEEEEEEEDEEDDLDNDSYTEGPVLGLLTEIPNLLDPKQIEALHMIVKSCILDSMGNGPTPSGENLQQARCKIFLASESGRSLLRELLVFVAVWDQSEAALIWDITVQILQAIHEVSLLPYAWTELRIPKDVVSPAQAVMLRMLTFLFRCRYLDHHPRNDRGGAKSGGRNEDDDESTQSVPPPRRRYNTKVGERDIKLVHFLFTSVRCRIVPECLAFMTYQGDIRRGVISPDNFPVETWDMDRARDGLSQVLEFITMLCEIDEIRAKLVEWGAASEIIMLLKGLEDAVPKKPLVDATQAAAVNRNGHGNRGGQQNGLNGLNSQNGQHESSPPPPPVPQDPAYKFPWGGIKTQALAILASLLQPPPGRMSPGNETVQNQIMEEKGMVPLLNACVYDDHNRFARERVQLCLKYLMDGCDEANLFVRELVKTAPPPRAAPGTAPGTGPPNSNTITRLRVDGVEGEVKVQVRSEKAAEERAAAMARGAPAPAFTEEDARAAAVYSTSGGPAPPAGSASASGQNTAASSAVSSTVTNPPNPPLGTARQRKQRQKRQQRQQRQKLQEALEAHEAHQQVQNQLPQPSQVQSQLPQHIPQEAQQLQQQLQQQQPPPSSPQAQTGTQQHGQPLPLQQAPLPTTPRVFGPPPPPPAIPSLASLAAHLPPLPAGHPFQHGPLPPTHPLAQPILGQQSQQPMSAKTAEALAARRARCEALLGEIISLSDHTARMALSIERGEMPPLPDDTLMNFLKSQKFLERCRDRLTRPINGPPDALVEDGSNLTTSMLADPLGSLFSGLGVSGPPSAGPSGVPVGATSLEDQYRLVEQALLYLTEDLAKSSELSHLVR